MKECWVCSWKGLELYCPEDCYKCLAGDVVKGSCTDCYFYDECDEVSEDDKEKTEK